MKFIAGLRFSADLRQAARHSLGAPPRDLSLLRSRLPRVDPISMYHRLPHGRAWSVFGARSNLPMRAGLPKHRRVCPLVATRRFAWRPGSTASTSPARQMATSALRPMGARCSLGPYTTSRDIPTLGTGGETAGNKAAVARTTVVAPPASPVRPTTVRSIRIDLTWSGSNNIWRDSAQVSMIKVS